MKKLVFIFLLQVLINLTLMGQSDQFVSVSSFGIRQGANISFVEFSPSVRQGFLVGYNGGLVYRFVNEELFALQVELNYSQKGWTDDLDTLPNEYSRKLSYIELPFLTQIYLGNRDLKYYANLGTAVAYLLSEKETSKIGDDLYAREYYNKTIENNFDFSVVVELGLMYDSNIGTFNFGARYYYTISSLYKFSKDNTYEISRNQVVNISLTYFLFSR